MTRKANRRFFILGLIAVVLTVLAVRVHQQTGSEWASVLCLLFMFTAFVLVIVLGVAPWAATFVLRYPLHNTRGYRPDHAPEPNREIGWYGSDGWNRKHERILLQNIKALGLYIEPKEKS
jgi:hypothetical protein